MTDRCLKRPMCLGPRCLEAEMTSGRNGSGTEVSVIQCLYASMFFLVCLFVCLFVVVFFFKLCNHDKGIGHD